MFSQGDQMLPPGTACYVHEGWSELPASLYRWAAQAAVGRPNRKAELGLDKGMAESLWGGLVS